MRTKIDTPKAFGGMENGEDIPFPRLRGNITRTALCWIV